MALDHAPLTLATPSSQILPDLHRWAAAHARTHIDLGTGDGRFVLQLARRHPETAVIGIDTCLDHLHGSRRRHPASARFLRLDACSWPLGTLPAADAVTIAFPYGSLLRALVDGDPRLIARLDALLAPGSRLEVRVNARALIDGGIDPATARDRVVATLRAVGGVAVHCRDLTRDDLRSHPSDWSRRLGHGRATAAWLVGAVRSGYGDPAMPLNLPSGNNHPQGLTGGDLPAR